MRQVISSIWTAEQDAHLTPHLHSSMGQKQFTEIAVKLNRTWRAVEGRFYALKKAAGLTTAHNKQKKPAPPLKPPANGGRPFTPVEDRIIVELRDEIGATWQDIATALKRTDDTVRHRYDLLLNNEIRPRIIAKRDCLSCGVVFEYDRSDGVPLFRCNACRTDSGSPYAPGGFGSNGRQAPRLRP